MIRRNYAMEIANALAKADSQSLAQIGFELLESLGEARAVLAQFEEQRARDREYDRERKRRVRRNPVESSGIQGPPLVSPFSPTPPITPSDPPLSVGQSSPPPRGVAWKPERETALAKRLPSDHGRLALAAILTRCADKTAVCLEIGMILDGGRAGTPSNPEHVELALCDYAANDLSNGRWNSYHFRAHVQRAAKPNSQERRAVAADPRAGEFVGKIRALIKQNPGRSNYLPKNEVEKLGADVVRAYDAVGGADRFLNITPNDLPFLIRDFGRALEHKGVQ